MVTYDEARSRLIFWIGNAVLASALVYGVVSSGSSGRFGSILFVLALPILLVTVWPRADMVPTWAMLVFGWLAIIDTLASLSALGRLPHATTMEALALLLAIPAAAFWFTLIARMQFRGRLKPLRVRSGRRRF